MRFVVVIVCILLSLGSANAAGGKYFQCTDANGNGVGPWIFYSGSAQVKQICNSPTTAERPPQGRENPEAIAAYQAQDAVIAFLRDGAITFVDPIYHDTQMPWAK